MFSVDNGFLYSYLSFTLYFYVKFILCIVNIKILFCLKNGYINVSAMSKVMTYFRITDPL